MPDVIKHFVIYNSPLDYPGLWVLRAWYIFQGNPEPVPSAGVLTFETLEDARNVLPWGSIRLDRYPEDDPRIHEIWV